MVIDLILIGRVAKLLAPNWLSALHFRPGYTVQHCVQYCAMAKLHRVSTPEIVAHNIAEVESRSTSETLRATNFIVCLKLKTVAVLQLIYLF